MQLQCVCPGSSALRVSRLSGNKSSRLTSNLGLGALINADMPGHGNPACAAVAMQEDVHSKEHTIYSLASEGALCAALKGDVPCVGVHLGRQLIALGLR